MANCEKLENCPFYKGEMQMDSGLGAMYKRKYCEKACGGVSRGRDERD